MAGAADDADADASPRCRPTRAACPAPPPRALKGPRPRAAGGDGRSADGPWPVAPHGAGAAPRNAAAPLPPSRGEALKPRPDRAAPRHPPAKPIQVTFPPPAKPGQVPLAPPDLPSSPLIPS